MKWILRTKWLWIIMWALLAIGITLTMPSIDKLTKEKGQPEIEQIYKSGIAAQLQKEMNKGKQNGGNLDVIFVFHKNTGLNQTNLNEIKELFKQLEVNDTNHIDAILSPFVNKEAEKRLLSKDKKTLMAVATLSKKKDESISDLRERLKKQIVMAGMTSYLTGAEFINEDYAQTSIDGVKKTEFFTILFIISVLIFVFRSPITPIVSLLIVGISYLVSIGVVANLVEYLDFPFSNTTQIFLVLVLFGIGTDYNILLFTRFKEELAKGKSITEAIGITYQTAGKTVFFSGLAVLIGFSMLSFSEFSIYQSGVAVAVGVVFLLAVLFTLVPICMAVFGGFLFWPSKNGAAHTENRLWGALGNFSIRRSLLSIVMIIVVILPISFLYQDKLSFDNLQEIDPSFDSVKGFRLVSSAFGAGQTMQTTVFAKDKQALDSSAGLGLMDHLQKRLESIDGVKTVYGPTRPNGERIDQLYSNEQTKQLNEGLGKSTKGIEQISGGLNQASNQIKSNTSGDLSNVGKLVTGTHSIRNGLGQVSQAANQIQTGMDQGATGAKQLSTGITSLTQGMGQLNNSTKQILGGYQLFASELSKTEATMKKQAQEQQEQLEKVADQILQSAKTVEERNPQLSQDSDFNTILQTAQQLKEDSQKTPEVSADFSQAIVKLKAANSGLEQVSVGQQSMQTASRKLQQGAKQLADGLAQGAKGQDKVVNALGEIDSGLLAVNSGQKKLNDGLKKFESNMKELQKGLSKSSSGLNEISSGITKGNDFLAEMTGNSTAENFVVPEKVKKSKSFQQALDLYMSQDRKIAKWTITLDVDPYSKEAMKISQEIDRTIKETVKHTPYKDIKIGTGGVSASNDDLQTISSNDFSRTVLYMLVGIGLMLIILFRSFWISILVLLSLIVAYFTSLSLSELVFVQGMGDPGLSWTVPFFSFILIVALGVDYSIFLLMRFVEFKSMRPSAGILKAMKSMGGVVISAAIILCGTFAAMYPSGVTTLMQISTVVIIALMLLSFLLLPVFIPAGIAILDRQSQREQEKGNQAPF